jgi:cation:H+ antiporter
MISAAADTATLRRFGWLVALAVVVCVPAVALRLGGWRLDAGLFGGAILSAGFMLSWGAEAAESRISQGLIVALIALITVLPEYAVDFYYAFMAGRDPSSNYVHYAAANMTGANRLLVGLAWPLMVLLQAVRTKAREIVLERVNAVEIAFLMVPSLWAFTVLARNEIGPLDTVVLIALFATYVWRVSRLPKADDDGEEEVGPATALNRLSPSRQWLVMIGLSVVAALVILASAEPFAEAMVASGRRLGVDEFLLIQWLAPLASEAPAVTIAILFVLGGRAAAGLATLISDKINQWTLLVAMLPIAFSIGAGRLQGLPLDGRQHEEFFLTAAQSLFGIALLLGLRLTRFGALALAGLFAVQVIVAAVAPNDAQVIASLTWLAWGYLALAVLIAALKWRALGHLVLLAFTQGHPERHEAR